MGAYRPQELVAFSQSLVQGSLVIQVERSEIANEALLARQQEPASALADPIQFIEHTRKFNRLVAV
jgi:hypothetical protein